MTPVKISVKDKGLLSVKWDDDTGTVIKLSNLRRGCPCAICNAEKDERGPKYIPIYSNEQLSLSKITVVGKYAVGVEWKDGHNTGIYDFGYLRRISDNVDEVK